MHAAENGCKSLSQNGIERIHSYSLPVAAVDLLPCEAGQQSDQDANDNRLLHQLYWRYYVADDRRNTGTKGCSLYDHGTNGRECQV